jgi:hypothetical protein
LTREFVPRHVDRRELELPDFHALRHTAAMDCDDAAQLFHSIGIGDPGGTGPGGNCGQGGN